MADRSLYIKEGKEVAIPVAAGTLIELGNMVGVNGTGYLIPAGSAVMVVLGVASETVDNTKGADGDAVARVFRNMSFIFDNSTTNPVDQTKVGYQVYVEDSVTLATSTGGGKSVGKCLAVGPEGVQVWIS